MLNKSESYVNDTLHIISEKYVCVFVWAIATESVRQTWQTECTTCQWTFPLHSVISCCSPASWDRQPVITASTWAASRLYTSAPGALHLGQEALCRFFKTSTKQADYHSSPRRDMRPGILSNYFTLIIGTEWQCGKSTDSYHKAVTVSKSHLPQSYSKNKVTIAIYSKPFPLSLSHSS